MQLRGQSRFGPTYREAVLMHAIARLALHPLIPNIQTSWVKMGRAGVAACLEKPFATERLRQVLEDRGCP